MKFFFILTFKKKYYPIRKICLRRFSSILLLFTKYSCKKIFSLTITEEQSEGERFCSFGTQNTVILPKKTYNRFQDWLQKKNKQNKNTFVLWSCDDFWHILNIVQWRRKNGRRRENPFGKIAQKAVCRSVHCILSAELTKTHFFRRYFLAILPTGYSVEYLR